MSKDLEKNVTQDNYTTEKVNVISNCLLGSYVDGEYVISEEIKNELITIKKLKKSVFRNSVFCNAHIAEYGDVVFEVVFQKNTVKNIAMAELFVLENENKVNGYIQNTIRTKVGEFVENLDNFIEKAYAHFNISLSEEGGKEYKLKEDISIQAYINAKKNFNLNMAKLTKKEYNKLYRDYVTSRLELLKKTNSPYAQLILEKFNNEYAKIEKYFLQTDNYKAVSELLDKCIEDCSGINPLFKEQEKELRDKLIPIVKEFSTEADKIADVAQPKAIDNLNKQDQTRIEEIQNYENNKYNKSTQTTSTQQEARQERVADTNKPANEIPKKPVTQKNDGRDNKETTSTAAKNPNPPDLINGNVLGEKPVVEENSTPEKAIEQKLVQQKKTAQEEAQRIKDAVIKQNDANGDPYSVEINEEVNEGASKEKPNYGQYGRTKFFNPTGTSANLPTETPVSANPPTETSVSTHLPWLG